MMTRRNEQATATSRDTRASLEATPPPAKTYLLLVRLDSVDPDVERLLFVPSTFTFQELHRVLQYTRPQKSAPNRIPVLSLVTDGELDKREPDTIKSDKSCVLSTIFDESDFSKLDFEYEYGRGGRLSGVKGVRWRHEIACLGTASPSLRKEMDIYDEYEAFCCAGQVQSVAENGDEHDSWETLKEWLDAFTGEEEEEEEEEDLDGLKQRYKRKQENGGTAGIDPYQWNMRWADHGDDTPDEGDPNENGSDENDSD
ncbi:hypothetical protein BDV96DRAFT_648226 [Lophiotrema nucula]|uniref:Plasmid pRiA4b Orf3-like domain-containing protein n=1 Tax=Lophiotrema nucula TaxID=690887 RepID=A0A6A5Z4B4_9PLEO|nr:hypothetical protein BDV96DRAFT_648226 [Lophiotrema nucula]